MRTFSLKIVTPDGVVYDGQAESLTVRTTSGDLGILAGHTDFVAPLSQCRCTIVTDGKRCSGRCTGGMISVLNGHAKLIVTMFEWE